LVGAVIALFGKLTPAGPEAGPLRLLLCIASVLPIAGMAAVLWCTLPAVTAGGTLTYSLGGWPVPYGIPLVLDGMAWIMSALIVAVSSMVAIAAFSRLRYGPVFFFFLMLLIAGMEIVTLTADIFTMFVAFEIVAIAAYVLIAFDRSDAGILASLKYLVLSSVGILFFLFGVFLIYREVGTLAFSSVGEAVRGNPESRSLRLAVVALCVGIGVRTAFIPFHTWLPEAHAYAPHPVSALLSGVLIKISFFAMVRIITAFSAPYLHELLLWIGAVTALFAVIWALAQSDAKRLLAYHSISQMGYVLAAFGAATALSLPAAMAHAIFKSLLFLVVGTAIVMTGERDLFRMSPVGRRAPLLAVALLVGALSIAGIPPFNGFASKQLVSSALGDSPAYALLWVTAAGTTASFIKLLRIARLGPRLRGGPPPDAGGPGALIHVPVVLLAAACLATGVFAPQFAAFLQRLLGAGASGGAFRPAVLGAMYSINKLLDTGIVVGVGIVIYLLIMTKPGKALSTRIKSAAPQLETVLVFFFLGLGAFALVALV
jgi:multicomponent Na+:H+ antiporter subunit D